MSHKLLITHNLRQNLDDSQQIKLKWNKNVDKNRNSFWRSADGKAAQVKVSW